MPSLIYIQNFPKIPQFVRRALTVKGQPEVKLCALSPGSCSQSTLRDQDIHLDVPTHLP